MDLPFWHQNSRFLDNLSRTFPHFSHRQTTIRALQKTLRAPNTPSLVKDPDRFYRSSLPLTWREGLGKGIKGKVLGFGIGVAVVGVAHLLALAEDRVGLVEKEDDGDALGSAKDALQVLFRLSDILVDHGAEVHTMQISCKAGSRE